MWVPLVERSLSRVAPDLAPGSRVLEIGYGNGLLACYMADRFGWQVTGYEIDEACRKTADANAQTYRLSDQLELRCARPEDTWKLQGTYDAVVTKTVMYTARTIDEYAERLAWVRSVLRPGGVFVNFETGRGHWSIRLYRRLRRREHSSGLCLYNGDVEALFRSGFSNTVIEYAPGMSWFLSNSASLYPLVAGVERRLVSGSADLAFAVAVTCRT